MLLQVCYMDREDGMMLRGEDSSAQSQPSGRHFSEKSAPFVSKLAPVPEASPLGNYPPCQVRFHASKVTLTSRHPCTALSPWNGLFSL